MIPDLKCWTATRQTREAGAPTNGSRKPLMARRESLTLPPGESTSPHYIARQPGESEEDLQERAATEARAYGQAHPSVVRNRFISVHMDVEHTPDVKPESKPDPIRTAQPPEPRVVPKQSPPKPQPRILTIKEVECQDTGGRHWTGRRASQLLSASSGGPDQPLRDQLVPGPSVGIAWAYIFRPHVDPIYSFSELHLP